MEKAYAKFGAWRASVRDTRLKEVKVDNCQKVQKKKKNKKRKASPKIFFFCSDGDTLTRTSEPSQRAEGDKARPLDHRQSSIRSGPLPQSAIGLYEPFQVFCPPGKNSFFGVFVKIQTLPANPVQTRQTQQAVDCCVRNRKMGERECQKKRRTHFVYPFSSSIGYYWL